MRYFPPFRFDDDDRTLWRGREQLALTRKARDVLACLAAADGRWVSTAEILDAVWPDVHVQADNVKVLIHEIRRALGDDPKSPRVIRNEVGRGYAFIPHTDSHLDRLFDTGAEFPLFMNRDDELATLAEAFDAARTGSARVVLIRSEHGMGKTALCSLFLRLARATAPLQTICGTCIAGRSEAEPMFLFRELLTRLASPDSASLATAVQLSKALAVLARDRPLVMLLEDLQWSDPASLHVLRRLAQSAHTGKWLLIGTLCPFGAGRRLPLLADLVASARAGSASLVLDLRPVSVRDVAQYLDARFYWDCPKDVAVALHEATGGNPGMIVTAADGLIPQLVPRRGDRCRRDVDIAELLSRLPLLLRDSVTRELDRLTAEERTILEVAVTVGPQFTPCSVGLAAGISETDAKAVLAPLWRRGVLALQSTGPRGRRFNGPAAYRFRHPMYAELLAERSKRPHRRPGPIDTLAGRASA
jgi:predicted ATPase